ncbi:cadherin domain-containing protein [Ekhidna sp.]
MKITFFVAAICFAFLVDGQSFSSSDKVVFAEQSSGTVLDVNADLGDGTDTNIAYSLPGGDDSSLFSIDENTGVITFNTKPNFDDPDDLDNNSIYEIEVQASMGGTNASQNITIIVSPVVNVLKEAQQIGSTFEGTGTADLRTTSAFSADGSTIAIGAYGAASFFGEVTVYKKNDGSWVQVGSALTGREFNDSFGIAVDLNYDGTHLIVGSSKGANQYGSIRIFELIADTWTQIGADIEGNNLFDEFGASVSISADGSIVAAGAHQNGNSGDNAYVEIYENVGGSWTQVGDLIASENQGDYFGNSISLNADGSTIAIGAPLKRVNGTPFGEAHIYHYTNGAWTQLGNAIEGTAVSDLGFSVSINAAGNIVAIGSPGENNLNGAVRILSYDNGEWNQLGTSISGTRSRVFGYSVSLSGDGSTIGIGELVDPRSPSGNGSAYIYQFESGQWNQLGNRIDGDNDGDNFGAHVSLSEDGSTLGVGAIFLSGDPKGYVKAYNLLDIPPVFSTLANQNFNENKTGTIININATDEGGNADEGITYSISGGADKSFFEINENSGRLFVNEAFDFESPQDANTDNVYKVKVTANDGAVSTDLVLQITINDVNESPYFTSSTAIVIDENSTSVGEVVAADDDAGSSVSLSLGNSKDESYFTLINGDLSFSSAPDHESPDDEDADNVYEIDVIATDGSLNTTQAISVTVLDLNDNSPVFITGSSFDFDENSTDVIAVEATDADATSTITYTLRSSDDRSLFSINGDEISFKETPNFESPSDSDGDNNYEVTVEASDGVFAVNHSFTITLKDINEAPSITSSNEVNVDENIEISILTLTAFDEDEGSSIIFSLGTENDESSFSITGNELSFSSEPDAENPTDSDSNNEYHVNIIASDGELETSQLVTVTVNDLNDNSPVFITAVDVEENSTDVMNVVADDPDISSTISVQLGTEKDAGLFELTQENSLKFKQAPDFENPLDENEDNIYELELFVTDGLFETIQNVQVTIIDVNEVVLSASDPIASVSVYPNPVADELHISSDIHPITWRIINLSGQVIIADEEAKNETSINVSDITAGSYFIQLDNGEEQSHRRIIIKH